MKTQYASKTHSELILCIICSSLLVYEGALIVTGIKLCLKYIIISRNEYIFERFKDKIKPDRVIGNYD